MFKVSKLMFIYTDASIHPGAGDSVGVVDLPVQREVHTELPIIQGSELKGALREYFKQLKGEQDNKIPRVFGTAAGDNGDGAGGALGFSMARMVLFPIASLKGVFAWVTCPMCLENLKMDLQAVDSKKTAESGLNNIPQPSDNRHALIPQGAKNLLVENKIFLSEFPFDRQENNNLNKIAEWLSKRLPQGYNYYMEKLYKNQNSDIHSNLVLISDEMYKMLLKIKTEVVHRNAINKKGIAESLWTEENIPADTLFYSMLYAADPYQDKNIEGLKNAQDVASFFENQGLVSFILGGNQTVGRGWVSVTFI